MCVCLISTNNREDSSASSDFEIKFTVPKSSETRLGLTEASSSETEVKIIMAPSLEGDMKNLQYTREAVEKKV